MHSIPSQKVQDCNLQDVILFQIPTKSRSIQGTRCIYLTSEFGFEWVGLCLLKECFVLCLLVAIHIAFNNYHSLRYEIPYGNNKYVIGCLFLIKSSVFVCFSSTFVSCFLSHLCAYLYNLSPNVYQYIQI